MMLSALKSYLSQRGRATLGDLAAHFDAEPDALRGMLEILAAKGRVRRLDGIDDLGELCGGCAKCDASRLEIYEWTGARESAREML